MDYVIIIVAFRLVFDCFGVLFNIIFGYCVWKRQKITENLRYIFLNICVANIIFGITFSYTNISFIATKSAFEVQPLVNGSETLTGEVAINETSQYRYLSFNLQTYSVLVVFRQTALFATVLSVLSICVERLIAIRNSKPNIISEFLLFALYFCFRRNWLEIFFFSVIILLE